MKQATYRIKDIYSVKAIDRYQYKEWLLHKHYAKRIPPINYAFGLFRNSDNTLCGVCTFGTPCKLMNDGKCIFNDGLTVKTYELNRLVINDGMEKNALSYFVSSCLKSLLPFSPMCVVSYADIGESHHGYIYQATNWIYSGITEQTGGYTYYFDGDWQHPRTTVARFGTREHSKILASYPDIEYKKVSRKHRYFFFLGSRKDTKEMLAKLKYQILPYPKGDNKRYDSSYSPVIQEMLF